MAVGPGSPNPEAMELGWRVTDRRCIPQGLGHWVVGVNATHLGPCPAQPPEPGRPTHGFSESAVLH